MTLKRALYHLPYILILTTIVVLGLYLRLRGLPDAMPFFGDVGRTYLAGQSILDGHLTLTGPKTSVGNFHLGPLYYYLTAGALWLSDGNVLGPGIMVALGGGVTVILLSEYLRKQVSKSAALLGASILAFSPLVVEQSRIPIEPSLVPLFTMLWLWTLTLWWQRKKLHWLFLSLFLVFLGAQLNFSFVVLGAVSLFAFVWKSVRTQLRIWISTLAGIALILALFLKILLRGTTSFAYWGQMWQRYTFPQQTFPSGLLLGLTALCVILILKNRNKLSLSLNELLPLWYIWGFFSICAFFLKTVGGNHALAMIFPLPAIILSTALATQLKNRMRVLLCPFVGVVWLLAGITTKPHEGTLAQAQQVTLTILREAHNEPYQLIYRGHLDVYEAVDDHWIFLLNRSNNSPQTGSGKMIYLYWPHEATQRFPNEGREVVIDKDYLLQVSE